MNRNTESHFSRLPQMQHQRSSFDRSFSHKTTFNFGEVVPIFCEEVLPGDTFSVDTSKVVRLQTLLSPVFDNMYLDTYYFFVPNRLVWDHWKQFMGENTQSAWYPTTEYSVPTIGAPSGGFAVGTLADHFGLPVGVDWSSDDLFAPIALPFRGYSMIVNDFFRDQNIQDPLVVATGDASVTGTNDSGLEAPSKGGKPFIAAKYHDYFTSCLPSPQKGPAVSIPSPGNVDYNFKNDVPVYVGTTHCTRLESSFETGDYTAAAGLEFAKFANSGGLALPKQPANMGGTVVESLSADGDWGLSGRINVSGSNVAGANPQSSAQTNNGQRVNWGGFTPVNLWANVSSLPNVTASGTALFSINELRLAMVTQMYYEALARGGSRYEEQIAQFFGVQNPDSRIQHPEYLGGNRVQINVHEITNQAQSEQDFLGDLGAMSVTADRHSDFSKSFTEHGFVIGLVVARYDHSYCQGIHKKFLRKSKFDFYNPLFARIGEQPVYDVEIYADANSLAKDTVFGYQEAWAQYRYAPNMATGLLRPNVNNTLGHWALTDNYQAKPTLSSAWLQEDKGNVDRALAVSSTVSDQLFGDFYFNLKCVRPMPMYSVPGALGQF